jgi:hypothetical protein
MHIESDINFNPLQYWYSSVRVLPYRLSDASLDSMIYAYTPN